MCNHIHVHFGALLKETRMHTSRVVGALAANAGAAEANELHRCVKRSTTIHKPFDTKPSDCTLVSGKN